MAVTASMVARKAGVSQAVVSKILNNTSGNVRVSPATSVRVKEAAEELGYRPNAAARAMRRGSFNAIGLLFASRFAEAAVHPVAMWTVQQQLMARSMHLTMAPLPDDKLVQEGAVPQILKEWSVDGLLVSYTYNAPEPLLETLDRHRVPAIWMNRKLDADCVYLDDYTAGAMATQELIKAGHRRISYLGLRPTDSHYSAHDRFAGYQSALSAAGLGIDPVQLPPLPGNSPSSLPAFIELLQSARRPTALVTHSGVEASLMLMAAALVGLSIPGDLSLAAITDDSFPINGVQVNGAEVRHGPMGKTAVEMLLRKIQNPTVKLDPAAIAPRLRTGNTIAPAHT